VIRNDDLDVNTRFLSAQLGNNRGYSTVA
jgi:hypothetical protein